jgi:hypothetical protein
VDLKKLQRIKIKSYTKYEAIAASLGGSSEDKGDIAAALLLSLS